MAILQEMLKIFILDMGFKITDLRLELHLPGADGWITYGKSKI